MAINDFFAQAAAMEPDARQTASWELGIKQRGYYVVGAQMARTIDTSLGEVSENAGDTAAAIASYEKSLVLDPENTNAAKMLEQLQNPRTSRVVNSE